MEESRPNRPKEEVFFPKAVWAVFVLSMSITIITSIMEYHTFQNQKKELFEMEVNSIRRRIVASVDKYQSTMLLIRGFFIHAGPMNKEVFAAFMEEVQLLKRHPGIYSLGYMKVRTLSKLDSRIVFLAPPGVQGKLSTGNEIVPGPILKDALMKSRDRDLAVISKKIMIDNRPGLIFFIPVFDHKRLDGFLFCFMNAKEFFTSIFVNGSLKVDFEIYEGPQLNEAALIYDYNEAPHFKDDPLAAKLRSLQKIEVGGQSFSLFVSAPASFLKNGRMSHLWIFAGGTFVSVLLTLIVFTSKKLETQSRLRMIELQAGQKSLIETQNDLKDAIKVRDEFLSVASHELKNPMTTLKLQAQLLEKYMHGSDDLNQLRERLEKGLKNINNQIYSLNRLVEDMLDISRLRTGKLKIITSEFDLADLIKETVIYQSEQMLSEGYPTPRLHIEGNLTGTWDRTRMGQVLNNLMTNAIRYGQKKEIVITAKEQENTILVSVKDGGIGIAKEDQKRIFDKFERATSSSEDRGMGLGLYISYNIIQAHQGRLWVDSNIGQGSTFSFEVPKKSVAMF